MLWQTPIVNPVIPSLANRNPGDAPALFAQLISAIVGLLLIIATIWAFFQFILGGIGWLSSGGDKSRVEAARDKLTQAFIGLIIVFASWAVFLLILQFLGISPFNRSGVIQLRLPTLF